MIGTSVQDKFFFFSVKTKKNLNLKLQEEVLKCLFNIFGLQGSFLIACPSWGLMKGIVQFLYHLLKRQGYMIFEKLSLSTAGTSVSRSKELSTFGFTWSIFGYGCFASSSGTPQALLLQGTGGWLSPSPQAHIKYDSKRHTWNSELEEEKEREKERENLKFWAKV